MNITSFKLWVETRTKLRMIYAITGEPMIRTVDRLASDELKRVSTEEKSQSESIQKTS